MKKSYSVDYDELNKFNKTSYEWLDEFGEFKILHKINPIRLQYINNKIIEHFDIASPDKYPFTKLDFIDVGCGGGLITVPICKFGANVTAIDANQQNIKSSSEYAKKERLEINFINISVEEYLARYPTKLFDVVLCLEVVEHVRNQEQFICNLLKLLKPNGMVILSTINRTVKSYLQAIIAAEYILKWVPAKTHDYKKFLKPSELYNIIQQNNFYFKNLTGLNFNLLENRWLLSDDLDINYFACIVSDV